MDKKLLIFYSLFGLLMIGGALVLSLWVLPEFVISDEAHDIREGRAGVAKTPSTEESTVTENGSREKKKVNMVLVLAQLAVSIGTSWIVIFVGVRLKKNHSPEKPINIHGYLFKISRITGKSEYEIFCKAAENWRISNTQIKEDFKKYLVDESIPYYVNDFVRKNKKHANGLRISIFTRRWYKDD